MKIDNPRVVNDALETVSRLLEGKVRRARVCGCQPCKNEAESFNDWLAGPATSPPPGREVWWK